MILVRHHIPVSSPEMSAPNRVLELVKRFERNADEYRAPQYGKAVTRIEFINPLFECLGWDIDNRRGAAEKYKDVVHEAAIKIGGATKAPATIAGKK